MGLSFATTGTWFVTGSFYVPDRSCGASRWPCKRRFAKGRRPRRSRFVQFASLSMPILVLTSLRRSWNGMMLPIALLAAAALPFMRSCRDTLRSSFDTESAAPRLSPIGTGGLVARYHLEPLA